MLRIPDRDSELSLASTHEGRVFARGHGHGTGLEFAGYAWDSTCESSHLEKRELRVGEE